VRAKVLGSDSAADATPEWIAASMERIDELNTIQVLSADPSSQPKSVDIRITVPAALGVSVINAGGDVELINVGGPVSVANGVTDGTGGMVELRTKRAIKDDVTLRTRGGNIVCELGAGSAGIIDAKGLGGVSIIAPGRVLKAASGARGEFVGELGALGKSIVLRAGDGSIIVRAE
jgi:hypothetical protein